MMYNLFVQGIYAYNHTLLSFNGPDFTTEITSSRTILVSKKVTWILVHGNTYVHANLFHKHSYHSFFKIYFSYAIIGK